MTELLSQDMVIAFALSVSSCSPAHVDAIIKAKMRSSNVAIFCCDRESDRFARGIVAEGIHIIPRQSSMGVAKTLLRMFRTS